MKNTFYLESINEFEIDGYKIRVWRKQKKGYDVGKHTAELWDLVKKVVQHDSEEAVIAEKICQLKNVNAVECKISRSSQGIVVYKNWP